MSTYPTTAPQYNPCPEHRLVVFFGAVIGALGVTILFFSSMPFLLLNIEQKPSIRDTISSVQVVRIKKQELPPKKIQEKPQEPPKFKQQPKPPAAKPKLQNLSLPFAINPKLPAAPNSLSLPDLNSAKLDTSNLSDIFSMSDLDSPLVVLVRVPPVYPMDAKRRGIEGWVKVRFIVNERGEVEDITIQDGEPKQFFDASVLQSVSGWRFKVATVDGVPVKTLTETTVRFSLD